MILLAVNVIVPPLPVVEDASVVPESDSDLTAVRLMLPASPVPAAVIVPPWLMPLAAIVTAPLPPEASRVAVSSMVTPPSADRMILPSCIATVCACVMPSRLIDWLIRLDAALAVIVTMPPSADTVPSCSIRAWPSGAVSEVTPALLAKLNNPSPKKSTDTLSDAPMVTLPSRAEITPLLMI